MDEARLSFPQLSDTRLELDHSNEVINNITVGSLKQQHSPATILPSHHGKHSREIYTIKKLIRLPLLLYFVLVVIYIRP